MSKNQMQPILRAFFEEYLPDVKGVSANTLRSYRYSFRLLFQFLYEKMESCLQKLIFPTLTGTRFYHFSNGWKKAGNAAFPHGTSGLLQSAPSPVTPLAIVFSRLWHLEQPLPLSHPNGCLKRQWHI